MTEATINFNAATHSLNTGINLIEASAGTGKTYTIAMLVVRFVVEQGLDIKQILLVTFTKAATEELKDRVRKRLVEVINSVTNENSSITDQTIKQWLEHIEIDTETILKRIHLALVDIDQAGIYTIHGFCQRTLNEYALESNQLFNTELTGNLNALLKECTDDFWRRTIDKRSPQQLAILTSIYQTPDQLLASILLPRPDITLFPTDLDLNEILTIFQHLQQTHSASIVASLKKIQVNLGDGKFKSTFTKEFEKHQQTLIHWLNQDQVTLIPNFSIFSNTAALNGNKFRQSKKNPLSSEEQKQNYLESLSIDFRPFEALANAANDVTLAFRCALFYALQSDLQLKQQQLNVVSFDDLIYQLANALKSDKGKPLISAIQKKYRVALIDEFQDTDKQQWFIFSSLFQSTEHYLYLIGDPKQAIYKFRGADIHCYFSARQQANYQYNLEHNWRSHPDLVNGINLLFQRDQPFFSDQLNHIDVKAGRSKNDGALLKNNQPVAPIVLWHLDKNPNDENNTHWKSEKAKEKIQQAIISEIIELLNSDYSIHASKNVRPVLPKDIAILVRGNSQANEYQTALNQVDITAVINSKASVFCSEDAKNLFILLTAIAHPSDHNHLTNAIALDWFNLNGSQFLTLLHNEIAIDDWQMRFNEYHFIWSQQGLMPMMQKLMTQENIFAHLSRQSMAERRITNIQHCLELIQQAAIDSHLGINKTLDWLQKSINQANVNLEEQQLRLESDQDAINIVTMHSSKGLEYPIVFCPFLWHKSTKLTHEKSLIQCYENNQTIVDLGSEQFEHHHQLALQEEKQEDLRLLYVALTRAKLRCYINWADVRSKEQPNQSALAYLLEFESLDFTDQQNKLIHFQDQYPDIFSYHLIDPEMSIKETHSKNDLPISPLKFTHRTRPLTTQWQMSSYTALASLTLHETPELPEDKAREEEVLLETSSEPHLELPSGAHTGNVIHDLLENIPFNRLAENHDISYERDKSCLRYGLKTDTPELINQLLITTVRTPLSINEATFKLLELEDKHCLKEMPFYLSMNPLNLSQINKILADEPAFLPLSYKSMSGFLTGFIDLICQFKGKYYIIDYKSNTLDTYDPNHLLNAMRDHNYALQYWIYSLVLHNYLQSRLPEYDYQNHFGGVLYLFVRGMNEKQTNSGVYQDRPELKKIDQLQKLFKNE